MPNYLSCLKSYIAQILKFKLITPKSITENCFETNLSRFGLAGLPMAAILDFQFLISQPFKELQGRNSNMKLNTPKSIPRTYFETKQSIFGLAGYALVAILEF